MLDPYSTSVIYIVVLGFVVAFILAFGVGANDVATSFGTSVGSKVLTLRQACVLASIFEMLGAILVGYKVSDTMRKGIIDVNMFNNSEKDLMLGSLAALGGSGIWQILATYLKLPVSGTHSIVGATVGFSLISRGAGGVQWMAIVKIAASWFLSPVLSGAVSAGVYGLIYFTILRKKHSLEAGLRHLPVIYALAVAVNAFSIMHDGPSLFMLDEVPWWGSLTAAVIVGVIVAIIVRLTTVPKLRKKTESKCYKRKGSDGICNKPSSAEEELALKRTKGHPEEIEMVRFSTLNRLAGVGVDGDSEVAAAPTTPFMLEDKIHHHHGENITENGKDLNTVTTISGNPAALDAEAHLDPCSSGTAEMFEFENDEKDDDETNSRNLAVCRQDSALSGPSLLGIEISEHDPNPADPIFSFLQILTACFGSFAHGGNDVSNTIGPLVAIWLIFTEGNVAQKADTPVFILLYGGLGMVIGLWLWGRRVIQTIGTDLTHITPHSGFTIEIGSAFTVLLASKIGLPVSTTHCKVGSVVIVGSIIHKFKQGVEWSIFRNILLAWIVTVPVAGGISALLMWIFIVAGL